METSQCAAGTTVGGNQASACVRLLNFVLVGLGVYPCVDAWYGLFLSSTENCTWITACRIWNLASREPGRGYHGHAQTVMGVAIS